MIYECLPVLTRTLTECSHHTLVLFESALAMGYPRVLTSPPPLEPAPSPSGWPWCLGFYKQLVGLAQVITSFYYASYDV